MKINYKLNATLKQQPLDFLSHFNLTNPHQGLHSDSLLYFYYVYFPAKYYWYLIHTLVRCNTKTTTGVPVFTTTTNTTTTSSV